MTERDSGSNPERPNKLTKKIIRFFRQMLSEGEIKYPLSYLIMQCASCGFTVSTPEPMQFDRHTRVDKVIPEGWIDIAQQHYEAYTGEDELVDPLNRQMHLLTNPYHDHFYFAWRKELDSSSGLAGNPSSLIFRINDSSSEPEHRFVDQSEDLSSAF